MKMTEPDRQPARSLYAGERLEGPDNTVWTVVVVRPGGWVIERGYPVTQRRTYLIQEEQTRAVRELHPANMGDYFLIQGRT
jgi:hypothetical protein